MINLRKIQDRKNKKAISEMVSYVLFVVIAMGLAVGVYSFLKQLVPPENEEKCEESTAIAINDYSCVNDAGDRVIRLTLENKGYFTIDGFFIKATNLTGTALPTIPLENKPYTMITSGQYDFPATANFTPGNITLLSFNYTALQEIKKLHLQPYKVSSKGVILPCESDIKMDITDCGAPTAQAPQTRALCSLPTGLTTQPVAWWNFDSDTTAGKIYNCKKGIDDGTIIRSITHTTLPSGKAVSFSGVDNNYITIPSSADLNFGTGDFTISFWAKLDNINNKVLISKWPTSGNQWQIKVDSNKIKFLENNLGPSSEIADKNTGNWQHIVIGRTGQNIFYKVNNEMYTSESYFLNENLDNIAELILGCHDDNGQNCMTGQLDEIMIFKSALTDQQISVIYHNQTTSHPINF
jgi:hypothetical protein